MLWIIFCYFLIWCGSFPFKLVRYVNVWFLDFCFLHSSWLFMLCHMNLCEFPSWFILWNSLIIIGRHNGAEIRVIWYIKLFSIELSRFLSHDSCWKGSMGTVTWSVISRVPEFMRKCSSQYILFQGDSLGAECISVWIKIYILASTVLRRSEFELNGYK